MKLEAQFKSLDHSEALVEYTKDRLNRIEKLEMKPVKVQAIFSQERHLKKVVVSVKGIDSHFNASAESPDFQSSVDQVVQKLMRQMAKEKQKVQKAHKLHKYPKVA